MSAEIDEDHHAMMNGPRIQQGVAMMVNEMLEAVRFNDWWRDHGRAIFPALTSESEDCLKRIAAEAWIAAKNKIKLSLPEPEPAMDVAEAQEEAAEGGAA